MVAFVGPFRGGSYKRSLPGPSPSRTPLVSLPNQSAKGYLLCWLDGAVRWSKIPLFCCSSAAAYSPTRTGARLPSTLPYCGAAAHRASDPVRSRNEASLVLLDKPTLSPSPPVMGRDQVAKSHPTSLIRFAPCDPSALARRPCGLVEPVST